MERLLVQIETSATSRGASQRQKTTLTSLEKPLRPIKATLPNVPVLGITGTGGAGKSSMVDELVRRFLLDFDKRIALISVDPSKRKPGGALLGGPHPHERHPFGPGVHALTGHEAIQPRAVQATCRKPWTS